MRTFVAIKIPVEQKLMSVCNRLKDALINEKIRWVDFSTLHLTLFFIGDTEERISTELKRNLNLSLANFPKFSITLKGLGTFGAKRNPKVVWVGVEPSEDLKSLHKLVSEVIVPLGYEPDERGFNPHITLGRVKFISNSDSLNSVINDSREIVFQQTTINSVIHYKSHLTPKGAIYTPLFRKEFI